MLMLDIGVMLESQSDAGAFLERDESSAGRYRYSRAELLHVRSSPLVPAQCEAERRWPPNVRLASHAEMLVALAAHERRTAAPASPVAATVPAASGRRGARRDRPAWDDVAVPQSAAAHTFDDNVGRTLLPFFSDGGGGASGGGGGGGVDSGDGDHDNDDDAPPSSNAGESDISASRLFRWAAADNDGKTNNSDAQPSREQTNTAAARDTSTSADSLLQLLQPSSSSTSNGTVSSQSNTSTTTTIDAAALFAAVKTSSTGIFVLFVFSFSN